MPEKHDEAARWFIRGAMHFHIGYGRVYYLNTARPAEVGAEPNETGPGDVVLKSRVVFLMFDPARSIRWFDPVAIEVAADDARHDLPFRPEKPISWNAMALMIAAGQRRENREAESVALIIGWMYWCGFIRRNDWMQEASQEVKRLVDDRILCTPARHAVFEPRSNAKIKYGIYEP